MTRMRRIGIGEERGARGLSGFPRKCLFCLLLAFAPAVLGGCDPMGLGQGYVVLKDEWHQERERMRQTKRQRREEKERRKEERIAARCAREQSH